VTLSAIVLGAGGHARVIGSILHRLDIPIKGYLDAAYKPGDHEEIKYARLIGHTDDLGNYSPDQHAVYIAVGDNHKRAQLMDAALQQGYKMPALIHPGSQIEQDCKVGEGSVVCMGALLATEVAVGQGVIINTGCSVDHEAVVGDYTHIAPRAVIAGRVRVGKGVFIGIGACIAQGLNIGDGSIIGAGSIVLKDVPAKTKITGVHH
jgi:sugar O-acyltransferase (sialic acid O-acetyltransferase NeuD family)